MRHLVLAFLPLLLAACTALGPSSPGPVHYRCDDGRSFAVTYQPSGQTASIEFERMRFGLVAESTGGPGQRYRCEVLALSLDGDQARLEVDGQRSHANCRRVD